MGLAAPINSVTGELEADGILPGWHGIRPAAEMEARLGVPVQLENDANVGALGERVFGAGRGVEDLIYVRLSAGIGAGLVLGGRPYRGHRGVAGEIGHILVDRSRPDLPLREPRLPRDDREPGRGRRAPLAAQLGQEVTVAELLELVAGRRPRRRGAPSPTRARRSAARSPASSTRSTRSSSSSGGELASAGDRAARADPGRDRASRASRRPRPACA